MVSRKTVSRTAALLREVARLHVRAQRALIARRHIPLTHCTILTELTRQADTSVVGLAARLRVDKGWVSRVLDQMERESLIARRPNPNDARAVRLTPTAAGRRLHRSIERLLDAQVDRVIARMPHGGSAALARLLPGLLEAYREEAGG